jgi:hypothetical protein
MADRGRLEDIPDHEQRIRRLEASLANLGRLEDIPDQEQRIRRLEASQAKLIGAVLAASAIASTLGTWLGLVVVHH